MVTTNKIKKKFKRLCTSSYTINQRHSLQFLLKMKDYSKLFLAAGVVLPNFQYGGGSVPIFGVPKFMLNQYLGSVNYNMDKNSLFGVYKSEGRKNRGILGNRGNRVI